MEKAFKQTQSALNQIQTKIKQKLLQIQGLDYKCLQIEVELEKMRQNYLEQLMRQDNDQDLNSGTQNQTLLQSIRALESQLKKLTNEKIEIAEFLDQLVTQKCLLINQQINLTAEEVLNVTDFKKLIRSQQMCNYGFKKQKGRQKAICPEIKAILKQYYECDLSQTEELIQPNKRKNYCICISKKILFYPGDMIECQNGSCPIGWYHFECVGLNSKVVPSSWFCELCTEDEKEKKKSKKVTFFTQTNRVVRSIKEQNMI